MNGVSRGASRTRQDAFTRARRNGASSTPRVYRGGAGSIVTVPAQVRASVPWDERNYSPGGMPSEGTRVARDLRAIERELWARESAARKAAEGVPMSPRERTLAREREAALTYSETLASKPERIIRMGELD